LPDFSLTSSRPFSETTAGPPGADSVPFSNCGIGCERTAAACAAPKAITIGTARAAPTPVCPVTFEAAIAVLIAIEIKAAALSDLACLVNILALSA
jgi:hypothetical protein